jgi:hypothetical protein
MLKRQAPSAAPAKAELIAFLTEDELCKHLAKTKAWAQRARFEGTGPPYVKAGRKPLYPVEWVNAWLLSNTCENTTQFKIQKKG